jgi:hypothetical protein
MDQQRSSKLRTLAHRRRLLARRLTVAVEATPTEVTTCGAN